MPKYRCDSSERIVKNSTVKEIAAVKHQNIQHITFDAQIINYSKRKDKKAKRTSEKAYRIPSEIFDDAVRLSYNPQISHSSSHQDAEYFVGDIQRSASFAKYAKLDDINEQLVQRNAKALMDQISIIKKNNSRNGVSLESTAHFSDALETLKLNRSSFLQRIQPAQRDRETIKLFLDAQLSESRGENNSEMQECSDKNDLNEDRVSRRKYKDLRYSSESFPTPQPSDRIVILRPAPKVMDTPEHVTCSCSSLHSHHHYRSEGLNVKHTYFSLKDIKRILKRALGENQEKRHWISTISSFHKLHTRKRISAAAGDKASKSLSTRKPSSSSGDTQTSRLKKDSRPQDGPEISPIDGTAYRKSKLSKGSHSKNHEPDIFQEAKKHLSERLKSVNKSVIIENSHTPKTLGRILCSPEHYFSSPLSPKWDIKRISVSTEKKLSPRLSVKTDKKSDDNPMLSEVNDLGEHDNLPAFQIPTEIISKDINNVTHNADTRRLCEYNGLNETMLASPSWDQEIRSPYGASPSSSSICSPEKVENIKYGEEHQSPVSVLEPLLMEDVISPKKSSTGQFQPLQIDFEECILVCKRDPEIRRNDCSNEDEPISAYIQAVLQAAGLDWDKPLLSKPSPDEIIHTSFSYGDKLHQIKSDHDPKLLFDFVNDVLLEIYQQNFGCSPWSSYLKPSARSVPQEDHFINQVIDDAKAVLSPEFAHPTLDQLVGKDIAMSKSWLDLRLDAEEVVNLIAEDILEESVLSIAVMLLDG